jgi:hypothetical protein
MNTFAVNSIFVQSRLEKSDPGIACRRGPDLQKTLAALVLSEVPLKIICPAIFRYFDLRQFKPQPYWGPDCFGVSCGIPSELDLAPHMEHWQFRPMQCLTVFVPDNVNASGLVAAAARHRRHEGFPQIVVDFDAVFPARRGDGVEMDLAMINPIREGGESAEKHEKGDQASASVVEKIGFFHAIPPENSS